MEVRQHKNGKWVIRKGLRNLSYADVGAKTSFMDYFRTRYFSNESKAKHRLKVLLEK